LPDVNSFFFEWLGLFQLRDGIVVQSFFKKRIRNPVVCADEVRVEFQCAPKFDKGFVVTVDKIKFLP